MMRGSMYGRALQVVYLPTKPGICNSHKFTPSLSKFCNKCKIVEGSYFHCIFGCPFINDFWVNVCKEVNIIFEKELVLDPIFCILGLHTAALNLASSSLKLLKVLLYSARRCVLLQWISDSAPTISQWTRSVMELIPLEAISFWLKDKPFKFFQIWNPFLDYIGEDGARALQSGLYGLAWTDISKNIS